MKLPVVVRPSMGGDVFLLALEHICKILSTTMALLAPNTVFSLTLVFGLLLGDVKALLGAVRLDRSPPNTAPCRSTTRLWGKVSRSRNKQAELARKLAEAKRQNQSQDPSHASSLSDEEIKERNDRQRFEELLQQKGSTVLNDFSADGYLTRQQEEEEIRAVRKLVRAQLETGRQESVVH